MYAWKRLSDGEIAQGAQHRAATPEELFERAGFGAVDVDKPLKGWLAVEVELVDNVLVEVTRNLTTPQPRPAM